MFFVNEHNFFLNAPHFVWKHMTQFVQLQRVMLDCKALRAQIGDSARLTYKLQMAQDLAVLSMLDLQISNPFLYFVLSLLLFFMP